MGSGPATGSHLAVRVKTGVTNSGGARSPTPASLAAGLHAPATTPGPVAQQFVTLGRFQLLSRLAVGGMAEVYLARQGELSGFKTLVVVKKVLPNLACKPDFIAMFLDEARIASMLDHPNIVRITEVGRAGDEYFLAMELVQGKPLAALLRHGERSKTALPHTLAALVVANAAAGLHHAHQLTDASGQLLGLVHRDVSPQNIMVSFEGSVKVIDFGIARALGRLGDTNAGSLKGKLGYMAPEQARGEPVDARADIFSLGVVLWECAAGRRLFLRENELATLRAVVYEPIPSPSQYAQVDPVLEAIIEHALARDLDERFQTAEEMRVALEHWVFAEGGTSSHDLAVLMKSWFANDYVQWQQAARLALDMQESDPPMDVSFPNLSGTKSGHSRTGSSVPGTAGTGPSMRWDQGSQSFRRQLTLPLPAPILVAARPKLRRRIAIPLVIVLGTLAGVLAYRLLMRVQTPASPPPLSPATKVTAQPQVLPTVETLPAEGTGKDNGKGSAAGTERKAGRNQAARGERREGEEGREEGREEDRKEDSEDKAGPAGRHGPGEWGGQAGARTRAPEHAGRKKNRSSSAEKRAILSGRGQVGSGRGKRHRPHDRKPAGMMPSAPRPNPF